MRSLTFVCALFVACGGEADVLGGSGGKPAAPDPVPSEEFVEYEAEGGTIEFTCKVPTSVSVVEPEAWYGLPLDVVGPVHVGFDASVPEAGRIPLHDALAWFEGVSDGFEFVWVADNEARDIGFTVDAELGAGGYCTGCCNGAARTAEIVFGTMEEGSEAFTWIVAIHEMGHALGLPHILPTTWRSVMNRFGPFSPTSPYADGHLDAQLVCALHNGALGCFEGDEAARETHLGLGFQDADGIPCPGWVPPVPPIVE